jgi:hypothetical protein
MSPITRRKLLKTAGIGAAGIGIGATGNLAGQDSAEASGLSDCIAHWRVG